MSNLRVVVDAHMVGHRETGNETYVVGLLSGLGQLPQLQVAAAIEPGATLPKAVAEADIDLLPLETRGNWSRLGWGLDVLCRRWQADLFHATYIAPLRCACPFVVTVHDVSFRRYPGFFSPRDRLLFATLLPLSLRRAAAVLTDSQYARREIAHFYPSLQTPVTSVALGVGPEFRYERSRAKLDAVKERYETGQDFILAVGNLQPRKNLSELIRAFGEVHERYPAIRLVIAGQAQWQASPLFRLVESMGLASYVSFPGYISPEDLPILYGGARVFVYPSRYEGFGLPVLEAMACGTPVVAVNTSSIPEVAGDAALLTDAPEATALATAVLKILEDQTLARRLSERGRRRAQSFSWSQTARHTRDVYRAAVEASRSGRAR